MPFTFSHPAIVLPATALPKRFYSLTGLIIGSVTPDFEYFIRMQGLSMYSHTIAGIFWFDLPLGFLLAFIYHGIVRDALVANLPGVFRTRLSQFCQFNWPGYVKKNWPIVIVSLIIGATSHLFWDSFTHEDGFFVLHLPILQKNVEVFGFTRPICNICQHLSTVVGGVAILYYILQLPKDERYAQPFDIKYWVIIFVISLLILVLKDVTGHGHRSFEKTIVTIISSGLIAITVTSWFYRAKVAPLFKEGV